MVKLLVSVGSVDEAKIALASEADFIDLKDPRVGALGNLDDAICAEIVQLVNKQKIVSATVGEQHKNANDLLKSIDEKLATGVDIIKLPVNQFFDNMEFISKFKQRVDSRKAKFIAVMFADEQIDLALVSTLTDSGFYGAMLDISNKQNHLFDIAGNEKVGDFVNKCKNHHLITGLAGSLRSADIESAIGFKSTYIGFRSGVCVKNVRNNSVSLTLINEIKQTLLKHNTLQ